MDSTSGKSSSTFNTKLDLCNTHTPPTGLPGTTTPKGELHLTATENNFPTIPQQTKSIMNKLQENANCLEAIFWTQTVHTGSNINSRQKLRNVSFDSSLHDSGASSHRRRRELHKVSMANGPDDRWAASEPRTATDRMCTDARCKRSLCDRGSRTHSNHSRSNIIIPHSPKSH